MVWFQRSTQARNHSDEENWGGPYFKVQAPPAMILPQLLHFQIPTAPRLKVNLPHQWQKCLAFLAMRIFFTLAEHVVCGMELTAIATIKICMHVDNQSIPLSQVGTISCAIPSRDPDFGSSFTLRWGNRIR